MRQRKHKDAWVRFHAVERPKTDILHDEKVNERCITLVGTGRNAYLWIGVNDQCVATFSGRQALRALARSILST